MKKVFSVLAFILVMGFGCSTSKTDEAATTKPSLKDRPGVVVFSLESKSTDQSEKSVGTDVAQSIIEGLIKGKLYRPIEREELTKILQEQEMGLTGLIDEKDALKVGKIAGAKFILLGSINVVAGQIKLNARLLDVETAEIVKAESVYGEKKDVFKLADQLAKKFDSQ